MECWHTLNAIFTFPLTQCTRVRGNSCLRNFVSENFHKIPSAKRATMTAALQLNARDRASLINHKGLRLGGLLTKKYEKHKKRFTSKKHISSNVC